MRPQDDLAEHPEGMGWIGLAPCSIELGEWSALQLSASNIDVADPELPREGPGATSPSFAQPCAAHVLGLPAVATDSDVLV
jgi:hypothetical protein